MCRLGNAFEMCIQFCVLFFEKANLYNSIVANNEAFTQVLLARLLKSAFNNDEPMCNTYTTMTAEANLLGSKPMTGDS